MINRRSYRLRLFRWLEQPPWSNQPAAVRSRRHRGAWQRKSYQRSRWAAAASECEPAVRSS